jgi:hypothetical protein
MRWLNSMATRLAPVAFLVLALIAAIQFWLQHHPDSSQLGSMAGRSADFYMLTAGAFYVLPGSSGCSRLQDSSMNNSGTKAAISRSEAG